MNSSEENPIITSKGYVLTIIKFKGTLQFPKETQNSVNWPRTEYFIQLETVLRLFLFYGMTDRISLKYLESILESDPEFNSGCVFSVKFHLKNQTDTVYDIILSSGKLNPLPVSHL